MKKITFILLALITTGTAFGQNAATASAAADIVSPLKIIKKTDLNFGIVAPEFNVDTDLILNDDGSIDVTSTASSVDATNVSVATFEISAANTYSYILTVPTTTTLTNGPGPDMIVNLDPSLVSGTYSSDGTLQTLNVGGTLNLAANQAAGTYNSSFEVTVSYE